MVWIAAVVAGLVAFHDVRHIGQVIQLVRRLRVPLYVLSTPVVAARFGLLVWAYFADQYLLFFLLAFGGQLIIGLLYRIDVNAMRIAADRVDASTEA